jgi:hypothetical protein
MPRTSIGTGGIELELSGACSVCDISFSLAGFGEFAGI